MVRKITWRGPQAAITVGDINGDNTPDIVWGGINPLSAAPFPVSELVFAALDSTGGYAPKAFAGFPGHVRGVDAHDLNGDGTAEVAAVSVYPVSNATTAPYAGNSTLRS